MKIDVSYGKECSEQMTRILKSHNNNNMMLCGTITLLPATQLPSSYEIFRLTQIRYHPGR